MRLNAQQLLTIRLDAIVIVVLRISQVSSLCFTFFLSLSLPLSLFRFFREFPRDTERGSRVARVISRFATVRQTMKTSVRAYQSIYS